MKDKVSEQPERSFTEKLQWLFANIRNLDSQEDGADAPPHGLRDLTRRLNEAGCRISVTQVGRLLSGEAANPRHAEITALARVFGVPVTYFFDDEIEHTIREDVRRVIDYRNTEAGRLVQRVIALPDRDQQTVTTLIDQLESYATTPRDQRSRRRGGADEDSS